MTARKEHRRDQHGLVRLLAEAEGYVLVDTKAPRRSYCPGRIGRHYRSRPPAAEEVTARMMKASPT